MKGSARVVKKYAKNQEASYDFRLGFALPKRPLHLHRAYLVTECRVLITTVP